MADGQQETNSVYSEPLKTTFAGVATSPTVVQFRGIKFASISQRFARSQLVTAYKGDVVDATAHGPRPPGRRFLPGANPASSMFVLPPELRQDASQLPAEDEFECLRLNITMPKQRGGAGGALLPVLVNIPGGANAMCVSPFDYTRLVEASVEQGKPIIVVHVPYRVGLFGFGLLPDGKGGSNNALFDQRNAFEWLKRNIAAFGGDAARITAAGVSAGAVSIDCHLQAKTPPDIDAATADGYFRRAVLSSGTMRTLRPMPVERQIALSQSAAAALGFGEAADWPEKLIGASMEEIVDAQEKLGLTKYNAVEGGEWFEPGIGLDKPVVARWVESIVIGDVGFEVFLFCVIQGIIWAQKYLTTPASVAIKTLEAHGELGKALLAAYPDISADGDPRAALKSILNLLQDLVFSHPNHALAGAYKAAGVPVFQYLFDQANPWAAATHRAHHGCDMLYWFGAVDLPTPADRALSAAMQTAMIDYTNGTEPWGRDEPHAFGPDGFVGAAADEEVRRRRRVDVYRILDRFPAEEYLRLSKYVPAVLPF